jgi:hypothetical protein
MSDQSLKRFAAVAADTVVEKQKVEGVEHGGVATAGQGHSVARKS